MIKILIPTDFSKLSRKAIDYAVKLSSYIDAELVLFNVVYMEGMPFATIHSSVEDKIIATTLEDFEQLLADVKKGADHSINIRYHVKKGYPESEEIENYALQIGADLIIMGTRGASGLKKLLIGSNATETIRHSSIPVITVPQHTQWEPIKTIACAIEITDEAETFGDLVAFARIFDAVINLVHVFPTQAAADKFESIAFMHYIRSNWEYDKITFTPVIHSDVVEGLDTYLKNHKTDMLAMATRKRSLFEKFYDKSITSEMAFHSTTPLFCFKS
jgi:nucleotide-binding universal stress UspA family protein